MFKWLATTETSHMRTLVGTTSASRTEATYRWIPALSRAHGNQT